MQGYDAEKALAFVLRTVNRKGFAGLGSMADTYLREAQALDLAYMREADVIDDEGYQGEGFYDEDDALEYIVEGIVEKHGLDDDAAVLAASVVDAYLQAHDAFMRKEGLS